LITKQENSFTVVVIYCLLVGGTTKACHITDVNVKKRTVWNMNEEESNKDEEERGIQSGNKRNVA
jgi:hypothetical protein